MADSFLRRRVWRKLQSLPDERLYQVLDYVEFLEEKYGEEPVEPDSVQKIAEGIQDRLRARRAAPWAIKGVMGALSVVDRAMGSAAKAARGLADEIGGERAKREKDQGDGDGDGDEPSTRIVVE